MTLNMLTSSLPCHQYDGWCGPSPGKATLKHGFFTACGGISRGVYESLNCGYGSNDEPAFIDETVGVLRTDWDLPQINYLA